MPKIIFARLLFVMLFKIWPISAFSQFLLRMIGVKCFKETLWCRKQFLCRLAEARR